MPHNPARVGAGHQQHCPQQPHRQSAVHLPQPNGLRRRAARLHLSRAPEQPKRRSRRRAAHKAHRRAVLHPREAHMRERRRHAQRERIQIRRKLIEIQAHVRVRRGDISPRRQRNPHHGSECRRRLPPKRARQQRKNQIELHFQRQRPQRTAEVGGVIGIVGEHLRVGQVACHVAQHKRAIAAVSPRRQRHAKHHGNRQQIGRMHARQPLFIKRRRALPLLPFAQPRPRQIQAEAADEDHHIHPDIPGAHQRVKADLPAENRQIRVEPRLLPDVVPRDNANRQRAHTVAGIHMPRVRALFRVHQPSFDRVHRALLTV